MTINKAILLHTIAAMSGLKNSALQAAQMFSNTRDPLNDNAYGRFYNAMLSDDYNEMIGLINRELPSLPVHFKDQFKKLIEYVDNDDYLILNGYVNSVNCHQPNLCRVNINASVFYCRLISSIYGIIPQSKSIDEKMIQVSPEVRFNERQQIFDCVALEFNSSNETPKPWVCINIGAENIKYNLEYIIKKC